jgi:hypothetical protein
MLFSPVWLRDGGGLLALYFGMEPISLVGKL